MRQDVLVQPHFYQFRDSFIQEIALLLEHKSVGVTIQLLKG